MQRGGRRLGGEAAESWRITEDLSWPLTVTLYIRDVLKLPATKPFFIPPLVPEVPEHIPVTGPEVDEVLAEEWAAWFSDILSDHQEIPRGGSIEYFSLHDRAPGFQDATARYFQEGVAVANNAFEYHFREVTTSRTVGLSVPKLLRTVERGLGRKANPFVLSLKILPVEGFWLQRTGPHQVLMSGAARRNPEQLHRLLGPVIGELA